VEQPNRKVRRRRPQGEFLDLAVGSFDAAATSVPTDLFFRPPTIQTNLVVDDELVANVWTSS